MLKNIKFFLFIYLMYSLATVYQNFYKVWYTFNINSDSLITGRTLHARGAWTGFDLVQQNVVNTANGLTSGLTSFYGMPLIVIAFAISLVLLYFGFVVNSFALCLVPFICSIYVKSQISALNFKMFNPLYGGSFNSSTSTVSETLSLITTAGYIGVVFAVISFINYRKENKEEANKLFKKVLSFSRESE